MYEYNEIRKIPHRRGMSPKKFARRKTIFRYRQFSATRAKGLISHHAALHSLLDVARGRRYYLNLKFRMQFITDTGELVPEAPEPKLLSSLALQVKQRGKAEILNDAKYLLRVLLDDVRKYSNLSAGAGFKIP
ncbi:hypothetical protein HAP94_13970 [Acidithiobacillus ferrivorans]|nr:hypothetical protein [Acidithiobacillus ferrivorans]